jgi:outer membrane protein OmpA-like peptidoglycan-associated protein
MRSILCLLLLICASLFCPLAAQIEQLEDLSISEEIRPNQIPNQTLWASRVIAFSAQAGQESFAADKVLSKPDAEAGKLSPNAWMPRLKLSEKKSEEPTRDWISLGFSNPIEAEQVWLVQNFRQAPVREVWGRLGSADWTLLGDKLESSDSTTANSKSHYQTLALDSSLWLDALLLVFETDADQPLFQLDAVAISNHKGDIHPKPRLGAPIDSSLTAENLGPQINSFFDEVFPVISPDGRTLYFDRKGHPQNMGSKDRDDIWYSELDSSGNWQRASNPGPPLNDSSHNFLCSISPDGQTALLGTVYDPETEQRGPGLAIKAENGWHKSEVLDIHQFYNEDPRQHAEFQLSSNGQVILMALQRQDALGARDLYASFSLPDGKWTPPMNLGSNINSAGMEISPFLASDMKTLYFSSNGFPGYGDQDMFMSKRLDESWTRWSEPINMGPPFNSAGMDAYYTLPANGDYAYFASSNQSIGQNDIFRIPIPPELQPDPVVLIKGLVVNDLNDEAVEAQIQYIQLSTGKTVGMARSSSRGDFQMALPYGQHYSLQAEADGFFALEERLDLRTESEYTELRQQIRLIPLSEGQIIPMPNVYFDVNRSRILDSSFVALNRLVSFLNQYPQMQIEIGGHTNSLCDAAYCKQLSERRAESVVRYLVKKGIAEERLNWEGYGSEFPIASNETDLGRKANQRVEFKIIALE